MTDRKKTEADFLAEAREKLVLAALPHVDFDGWSPATLQMAIVDSGVDPDLAMQALPRGALDLALAFHRRGDAEMLRRIAEADLSEMRFRDRIAYAIRQRLETVETHREAIRKGIAFFAMPSHVAEGSQALWLTADAIWTALGDTSKDFNYYTKRATLSAVYSASVLYWLGDESRASADTWAFVDRRIDNVMQFEKFKAQVKQNPLGKFVAEKVSGLFDSLQSTRETPEDLPGHYRQS